MVEIRHDGESTTLSVGEWEERVRAGRISPDAEIRFKPVTGAGFRRAGDLEMFRSLYDERALASQRMLAEAPPPWMTALLVGGQIRLWWLAQFPANAQWIARHGVRWTPPQLEELQLWRLLTSGFIHLDLMHAAMNLLWLAYVGWSLERALGPFVVGSLFVSSVLGGSLLATFSGPSNPSLGASGGVFGLIAAAVVLGLLRPHALPERTRQYLGLALLPYLIVMFLMGLTQGQVDNGAHGGGLITGAVLGALLDLRTMERRPGWNRRVMGGALGVLGVVTVLIGVLGPRLSPLDEAREVRAAAIEQRRGERPMELPGEATLAWSAPVGWTLDTLRPGATAFMSPTERSRWSVEEVILDVPAPATRVAGWWAEREGRRAEAEPAGDSEHATLTVTGEDVWTLDVVVRGRRARVATWQTAPDLATRLAPLHQRLLASIVWSEPATLRKARELPDSTDARARLDAAEQLLDAGEVAAAVAMARAARERSPERSWALEVRAAGFYPDQLDADAILSEALAADVSTTVTAEVALALLRLGRQDAAWGTLEIAWIKAPGDSALARMRTQVGLGNELNARGLPLHPGMEALRPVPPTDAALDLPTATREGARLLAWRVSVGGALKQAVADGSPRVGPLLLILVEDGLPQEATAPLAALRAAVLAASGPVATLDPAAPRWPELPWYGEALPPLEELQRALQAHEVEAMVGAAGEAVRGLGAPGGG